MQTTYTCSGRLPALLAAVLLLSPATMAQPVLLYPPGLVPDTVLVDAEPAAASGVELPYRVDSVYIGVPGAVLAGRMFIPDGAGPFPGLVMLPGARQSGNLPGVAEHLASHRIAVLDLNKRGVGGSSGSWKMTFERRTADAVAGLAVLRSTPGVDSVAVGMLGHSQGGWIAQMAASASPDVRFIVMAAGPAQTVFDQVLTYERIQRERRGQPSEDVDRAERALRRQLRLLGRVAGPCRALKLHYVCFMLDHDPAPYLAAIDVPVLALFAELDPMTPPRPNIDLLVEGLDPGHDDLTIHVFPRANHDFWAATTGLWDEYHLLDQEYVPGFLDAIVEWVHARAEEARRTVGEEVLDEPVAETGVVLTPGRRRPNRLGIALGGSYLAHQDVVHTPFVHGGTSPISFGLSYARTGQRWVQFAEARYSAFESRLGVPFEVDHGDHHHTSAPHGLVFLEAIYGVGRVASSGMAHSSAVGASARMDIQAAFYRYAGHDNFGYFMGPSLNLWYGRAHRLTPRHVVTGRIEAPLVTWLARSPYMVNDDRFIENIASDDRLKTVLAFLGDGKLVTWDRLQRLHAALDYEYALSRRFSAGLSYRFAFTRSTDPRPLVSYQTSLNLTTSVRF